MSVTVNQTTAEPVPAQQDLANKALDLKKEADLDKPNWGAVSLMTRSDLMRFLKIGSTALWKLENSADAPPRTMIGTTVRYDPVQIAEWLKTRQSAKVA